MTPVITKILTWRASRTKIPGCFSYKKGMSIEKCTPVRHVLTTISNNVIINIITLKLYPFLKKKVETNAIVVSRGDLFVNIKAIFF